MYTLCIRGNANTSTFANCEDPDEMQHDAAFHQGLHCQGINDFQAELKRKLLQGRRIQYFFKVII